MNKPILKMNSDEVNAALMKASRKMVLEEDGMVLVAPQDLKEVLFKMLEQAQVLAETMAKTGDENAQWMHKALHDLTESFDVRELLKSEEEEWERNYVPDIGRGETVA